MSSSKHQSSSSIADAVSINEPHSYQPVNRHKSKPKAYTDVEEDDDEEEEKKEPVKDRKRSRIVDRDVTDDDDDINNFDRDEIEWEQPDGVEEPSADEQEEPDEDEADLHRRISNKVFTHAPMRTIKGMISSDDVMVNEEDDSEDDDDKPDPQSQDSMILNWADKYLTNVRRACIKEKQTWKAWLKSNTLPVVHKLVYTHVLECIAKGAHTWKPSFSQVRKVFKRESLHKEGSSINCEEMNNREMDSDEHEEPATKSDDDFMVDDDDEDALRKHPKKLKKMSERKPKKEEKKPKRGHADVRLHASASKSAPKKKQPVVEESDADDGIESDEEVNTFEYVSNLLPPTKPASFSQSDILSYQRLPTPIKATIVDTVPITQWSGKVNAVNFNSKVVRPTVPVVAVQAAKKAVVVIPKPAVPSEAGSSGDEEEDDDDAEGGDVKVKTKRSSRRRTFIDGADKIAYNKKKFELNETFISCGREYVITHRAENAIVTMAPAGYQSWAAAKQKQIVKGRWINPASDAIVCASFSTCMDVYEIPLPGDPAPAHCHYLLHPGIAPVKVTTKISKAAMAKLTKPELVIMFQLAMANQNIIKTKTTIQMLMSETRFREMTARVREASKVKTTVAAAAIVPVAIPVSTSLSIHVSSSPARKRSKFNPNLFGRTVPDQLVEYMFEYNYGSLIKRSQNLERLQQRGRMIEEVFDSCAAGPEQTRNACAKLFTDLKAKDINPVSFAMDMIYLTSPEYAERLKEKK